MEGRFGGQLLRPSWSKQIDFDKSRPARRLEVPDGCRKWPAIVRHEITAWELEVGYIGL